MEVKLGDHDPGHNLSNSLKVISDKTEGSNRTIQLWRPLKGATAEHYTFDLSTTAIEFIAAVGSSPGFAYHKDKGASVIHLSPSGNQTVASCVCDGGSSGSIDGIPFRKRCGPEPKSDLLKEHNRICDIRTYSGGLECCHHQWFLLDADQEIPPQVEEYHLKFRIWFKDYDPNTIVNLPRLYWQTENAAGEYDVPKCDPGTPSNECVHTITSRFTVNDLLNRDCSIRSDVACSGNGTSVKFIYAGGHCHAATCLSMDLYNMDTGKLICSQTPIQGQNTEVFDEKGYIAIPPCIWGDEDELEDPPVLSVNTTLLSIKRCNSTYGHYGEMASWQMRGVVLP